MIDACAVILAGGLGTRMHPLTANRPKPALPIAGLPLIARQLRWLAGLGVQRAVIASGYRADVLRDCLAPIDVGLQVQYVQEDAPLGTGGALASATRDVEPDRPVIVLNGDQLTGHDLGAQFAQFSAGGAAVSIHARTVADPRPFGLLHLDGDQVTHFAEKPADAQPGVVNAGTYVLRANSLAEISAGRQVSLEREVFPALINAGERVTAFIEDAYCLDVGSPSALLQANLDAVRAEHGEAFIEGTVEPSAAVRGGSWIGAGATVGAHAVVNRSVVMPGAVVGAGARVEGSVVAFGARIHEGVQLQDNVIGENAHVRETPPPGTTVE